ncbi:universal stress protein [Nocardioides sp. AX2bis]|uniref:universal stress protein n=1 Tax=Nocardioides sp. AX2bis TaxID=2653157 RepID=UPI0012F2084C|nr:universal stress protein [Nocardioides sp. AX2bis]VXB41352.1 Universal stress protein MSMEG_4207 [Nocardioides sp. AX2bis]
MSTDNTQPGTTPGTAPGPVVVAWTPDEFGAVALEHGLAEAADRGSRVVVVNATKGDALVDPRYASDEAVGRLRESVAGQDVEVRQSTGADVAEQVLAVATEVGGSLVVLGMRKRTPVGKLLMGSVAQRVLLTADCPVLAVKPGQSTPARG